MSRESVIQNQPPMQSAPPASGWLQRQCACGQHTVAGSECAECRKKRETRTLQRVSLPSSAFSPQPSEVPPIVHVVLRSPGQPLDVATRAFMEPRFGHDFSRVRVHVNDSAAASAIAVGAAAYTVSHHIVFGPDRYAPRTPVGQHLLAHELAHVVQQDGQSSNVLTIGSTDSRSERQATSAAAAIMSGSRVGTLEPGLTGLIQRSPLSEELSALASEPKGRVFDVLRRRGPAPNDEEALQVIRARFRMYPDDLWLAETLLRHGPEPFWDPDLITRRVNLASSHRWEDEAGNIRAQLPYPAEAAAGTIPPVIAYFFPGSTAERALVIGGIHGNEVQGARTVESLRAELTVLSAQGRPPRFTTILIPVLNARIHDPDLQVQRDRYLPRRPQEQASDPATRHRERLAEIEPNRTFPTPGETYADARARARSGRPELEYTGPRRDRARSTTVMPPETRALVILIERFRPSRIASVHAHSIGSSPRPGNDPGIFVDPAIRRDSQGRLRTDPDRFDPAGDQLARDMLAVGRRRLSGLPSTVQSGSANPFVGNPGTTTRYSPSVPTYEGYSLGDWAPSLGINTITVEIPQYGSHPTLSGTVPDPDRLAVERLHRDVLLEVFLGVPSSRRR